jgi:signal transduction histidine kinase
MTGLYRASLEVMGSIDLTTILGRIAELARGMVRYHGEDVSVASVFLVEGGRINVVASYPPETLDPIREAERRLAESSQAGPPRGIVQRAIATGRVQNIADTLADSGFVSIPGREIRSELTIPITVDERVVGVIDVEHPEPHLFDADEVSAVVTLAAHASIAIQNVRRHEEKDRALRLAALGVVEQQWRHDVGSYAGVLETDVTLIRRVLQDWEELSIPASALERLERYLCRIKDTAARIREAPQLVRPDADLEPVDIGVFLRRLIDDRQERDWLSGITIDLEATPGEAAIRCNRLWLRELFHHLLNNASAAMEGTSNRRVRIRTASVDGGVAIDLGDSGSGSDDELRAILKAPFGHRGPGRGMGIGLPIAQTIAMIYGGEICVAPERDHEQPGVTVRVWFPVHETESGSEGRRLVPKSD